MKMARRDRRHSVSRMSAFLTPGIAVLLFFAYTMHPANITVVPEATQQKIIFVNDSAFYVSIRQESFGGNEICSLKPRERKTAIYNTQKNETVFYPVYAIPLNAKNLLKGQYDSSIFFVRASSDITEEITIPPPRYLENDNMYLVFSNASGNSTGLLQGNAFLSDFGNTGTTTINAGTTAIFEGPISRFRNISLYPSKITIPDIAFNPGFIYHFIFDGNMAALTDARPLTMIGEPAPVKVEFACGIFSPANSTLTGENIPQANWEKLIEELDNAFKRYQVPLYVGSSESAPWEQLVHHTIGITITIGRQAPKPPLNREMITGNIAVSLSRNGVVIARTEDKKTTTFDEAGVYSAAAQFIRENSAFYNRITQYIMP